VIRGEATVGVPKRHLRLVRPNDRSARARRAAATRRTVALLLGSTAFLTVAGLIMVLSASSVSAYAQYGSSFVFFQRQAGYALVGVAALVLTARMRYPVWQRLTVPLLAITVVLLALVLHPTAGIDANGASRWIAFGPVTIQPSEIAKLALIVFGAAVLAKKWDRLDDLGHIALPLLPVAGIVCAMVFLQPDLGTTIILTGTLALMLFVAGIRLRYLAIGGATMAAASLALLKDYQWARITAFLHPWADAKNTGYQLIQSLIALGSGGWLGVGLGASRQKWMYVPNAHTDFIFSILGEELGLLGELVVLLAFAGLIVAGIRVAAKAPDAFGRMLAAGIVSWFGLQIVVNLGAVTGLLPITGVPLPLLSYGGSSLVVSLAAVGILVNVAGAPVRAADRSAMAERRRRAA
jgi:cell division protein FtsW